MIGREKEIKELEDLYNGNNAELIAVYGRRRVGKTFLINSVFNKKFAFKHTAYSPKEDGEINNKIQLDNFYNSLILYGLSKEEKQPKNWFDAFFLLQKLLMSKDQSERLVVFFDEFPWLDAKKSYFIKAFEGFWNGFGCAQSNLMVIVCGSANSWIQNKLINNHGGLYGRVTYEIKLSPFKLKECEEFLNSRQVIMSRYDIATSYMIFGGIPYYLGYIKKELSLPQNIDNLFFSEEGILKIEFDRLFQSCFDNPEYIKNIVINLNEKRIGFTRKEITENLKISNGGDLTQGLNALISSGFIRKYYPFGMDRKNAYYQLIDPFCIFYLKFIYNKNFGENFWSSGNTNQTLNIWRGLSFENLCLNHIDKIKDALKIGGVISTSSSWYYKDDEENGQIDLLISRNDNVVNMCEIKFYSDSFKVDKNYYLKINRRDNVLRECISKKSAIHNTLITTYGIEKNEYSSIFQNVITLDDLF